MVGRIQSRKFGEETWLTFVNSPINTQPASKARYGSNTFSIQGMYLHRFGDNNPTATLPVQQ